MRLFGFCFNAFSFRVISVCPAFRLLFAAAIGARTSRKADSLWFLTQAVQL